MKTQEIGNGRNGYISYSDRYRYSAIVGGIMLTVGELRKKLKECPDNWVIQFSEKKAKHLLLKLDITYNSMWAHGKQNPQDRYKPVSEYLQIHMEAIPDDS